AFVFDVNEGVGGTEIDSYVVREVTEEVGHDDGGRGGVSADGNESARALGVNALLRAVVGCLAVPGYQWRDGSGTIARGSDDGQQAITRAGAGYPSGQRPRRVRGA